MNARAFLVLPAAVAVAVLAGCGLTDGGSDNGKGSGSNHVRLPSSEVCQSSAWIRDRLPDGLCSGTSETPVDDDLSPLQGDR
ncbi:hypothetical protein [Agromyces ramosus]|uniref:Lipoprotein n=1 Tax=Agromyces ramosus TaxID=33879 RepID=A0ABU0R5W7_9MICO|nr:hypothetical protein [Agromyces ramosus]MDQ0893479.1 hypothetical protein [Agromyces ramosus]